MGIHKGACLGAVGAWVLGCLATAGTREIPIESPSVVAPTCIRQRKGWHRQPGLAILMHSGGVMANEKSCSTESMPQIRHCDSGLSQKQKAPPRTTNKAPAVMGNFGQAVTLLLDTYSKCRALLKGSRLDSRGLSSEPPVRLASSLRSDQASIRRTYSSRLSQNGARFDKGDGECIES